MQLEHLDLNLLVLFARLMEERHLSRVAEALHLTQPAASNALARLRRALGDPLFVRTGSGMQPTPRALQLAVPVAQALAGLRAALGSAGSREQFVPAAAERSFTLALSDIGEIYFLPPLMQRLREQAPRIGVNIVRHTALDLRQALQAGPVDLALGLLPQLRGGFHRRTLFEQRYVCLLRGGHALAGKRLSVAAYMQAEHLTVAAAGTAHAQVDRWLARRGLRRNVRLTVPHFAAIGHTLAATDLVATVPERLAECLAGPFGLAVVAPPVVLPGAPIAIYWHERLHHDGANRWLRQWLAQTFGAG